MELNPGQPNALDFGPVQVNDRRIKNVVITNDGKFPFDFSWKLQKNPMISISPELGTVPKGEKLTCTLSYKPKKSMKLENFKMVCKITNGRKYILVLNGKAYKPALEFSFTSFDFGPCFLLRQGSPPLEKVRIYIVLEIQQITKSQRLQPLALCDLLCLQYNLHD
jgi:hydrocephalus-inducing protein